MVTIAFAHATGFCGGVWRPVIESLADRYQTITWDFPNHGSSIRVPFPVDWWLMGEWARDQVAGEVRPVIGVGHSMGGAALAMAEILAPGTFAALVLVEPMLLPPPYGRAENDLSRGVRKRRRTFASRQAVRENFVSKPPFRSWHPAALDGYVECGLLPIGGGDVELACTPEAEADVYEGVTAHAAWERLGEIDAPTLVIGGSHSDSQPPERIEAIAARFRRAGFEIVANANHFLPMEDPALIAARVDRIARATFRAGRAEL